MLKPSTIQRQLCGEIISRFEKKGLRIAGMKMMQLDDKILEAHYAHLVGKPFFPALKASNGRKADPGTIRGDYCMSNQQNIVHASDSPEAAEAELARFFKPEEIYELGDLNLDRLYAVDEN